MTFYVYILRCADGTYYTGSTNNIERRLKQHAGQKAGARYTKTRRPVSLQYIEEFPTLLEARRREIKIKSLTKEHKQKLWL